jgi:hypothetical protein
MAWIQTVSDHQRPSDLWDAEIMADHYDRADTPEWYDTDDGRRKANFKEPVARALVREYAFKSVDDTADVPDDTATDSDTAPRSADGPTGGATEDDPI